MEQAQFIATSLSSDASPSTVTFRLPDERTMGMLRLALSLMLLLTSFQLVLGASLTDVLRLNVATCWTSSLVFLYDFFARKEKP